MSDVIGIPPRLVADPRCVLYLRGDATNGSTRIRDWSPSHKTVTVYGNTCNSTAQTTFPPTSIYFDGTGDYLRVNDASIAYGSNDFTISFWMWETVMTPNYPTPFQFSTDGTYATTTTKLELRTNVNTVLLYSANASYTSISFTRTQGQWNHWALIKAGNVYTLYYNGVSVGGRTDSTSDAATYLSVGGDSVYFVTGNIDEFAYWKGVAIPIEKLYPQKQRMIV